MPMLKRDRQSDSRMRRHLFVRAFASVAALAPASHAQRSATLFGLGDLPGGDFNSIASRMSSDGRAVTGYSLSGGGFPGTFEAFRWTQDEGMIPLGKLDGANESYGNAVSAGGDYVVGRSGGEAFRWTDGVGLEALGRLDGWSFANGVSSDGRVVVGFGRPAGSNEAFRWTPDTGMVGLGFLPGASTSRAAGVSDDGAIIAGSSGGRVFLWREETGMIDLGTPAGWNDASAGSLSSTGAAIVGSGDNGHLAIEAFLWTADEGMRALGFLSETTKLSGAGGVTADGRYVVGFSHNGVKEEAFIWSEEWGMRSMREVLLDYGVDAQAMGWRLSIATGVTIVDDTLVIVGTGLSGTLQQEAWMAHIPIPAPASLAPLALAAAAMRRRR